MLKTLLASICLMAALSTALAAEAKWFVVIRTSSETRAHFIDGGSIARTSGIVDFWIAEFYADSITFERNRHNELVKSTKTRFRLSCAARFIQMRAMVGYTDAGEVVFTESQPGEQEEIVPDSAAATLADALCSGRPLVAQRMLMEVPRDKSLGEVAEVLFKSAHKVLAPHGDSGNDGR